MSESATSAAAPTSAPTSTESVGSIATEAVAHDVSPTQEVVQEQATDAAVEKVAEDQQLTKEEKVELKKWMLKSQGKTREVTSEAELIRLAQLGLGAHEKFEQASTTRKKAEAILELLQKDPSKALKSLGHDVRKLAEEYLMTEAQKQMMTPEERQKAEIVAEIDRLKAEKDQMLAEQREERIQKLQAKYETDIQDQIIKAIDQYKLPKNPKTVARIADYMASALQNGYEASPLDVAPRVRTDLEEEHKSLYNNYGVEDLIKLLGENKLKEIRQYEVNKVKAKAPASPVKTESIATKTKEDSDKPKKGISMSEFQAEMDKLLR